MMPQRIHSSDDPHPAALQFVHQTSPHSPSLRPCTPEPWLLCRQQLQWKASQAPHHHYPSVLMFFTASSKHNRMSHHMPHARDKAWPSNTHTEIKEASGGARLAWVLDSDPCVQTEAP